MNIHIVWLSPVIDVAMLQSRILNTRMLRLLILSPKSPEAGTSTAKAKLKIVAISPICVSLRCISL